MSDCSPERLLLATLPTAVHKFIHTADNLQLSNFESMASQSSSFFHNSVSSCYCFIFIPHLVLHGCYLSLVLSNLLHTYSSRFPTHGCYCFPKQLCLLASLSFWFTFKYTHCPLVIIQFGTLRWSKFLPWTTSFDK